MSDLISREKAFVVLSEYYHHRLDSQHLALREALSRVPSAEPMESHHRYEQGIIEGRVQMRTEMLKAIKDIVGDEVWSGI